MNHGRSSRQVTSPGPGHGEPNLAGSARTTVAELGEFGLITRVSGRLAAPPPPAGPGDDAALVAAPAGALVATTDLLVEGRHFRLDWSTPYDVGRKAAAQSLADVAAMGAVPTALLVGLACPPDTPVAVVDGIADGLRDECALVGAAVVGGDTVRGEALLIAVTALGDPAGPVVTRTGARAGDLLVLAGTVGRAAAGLAALQAGERTGPLIDAHRRPSPPYAAGPALAAAGATAMCDVSDGLLADAGHLAAGSGVAIEVEGAALRALLPDVPEEFLLTGGEDHGLLATLPATATPPAGVTVIGRVVAGAGVTATGLPAPERGGWDHFAR